MTNKGDVKIVHCGISAPAWRSFRAVLALRGQTIRASLESWVRQVVAEAEVVGGAIEQSSRDDRTSDERQVTRDQHDQTKEVVR